MSRFRIDWHGDFIGDGSLARVNRHLTRAVAIRGDIEIVPHGEPAAGVHAAPIVPNDDLPAIVLRHRWPPRFMNPPHAHYVHVQPWEFGSAPRAWVERLNARADDLWCYSNHVRDGYIAAGVAADRVHVVPLGFDPDVYHPDVEPIPSDNPAACIFLFVGGLIPRKDVAKVVEAYTTAFVAGDPVALLIKVDRGLGIYDDGGLAEQLRGLQELTTIPPIRLIEAHLDDADMARFYRMAAALVQPYRGEGFGLPMLEAMACGVPVVVSGGGSTDDFVDETVGYVLPTRRVALGGSVDGVELAGEGWWLEASTEALVATLRRIANDRAEARTKGRAAAERAHGAWTWAHAAEHLVRRADAVLARAARPSSPPAYADELAAYAWRGFSRNGEDGILIELFSRLGVEQPFFVELAAGDGVASPARLLAVRYGWPGLMFEADATQFAALRATFADLPNVRTEHAAATRTNAAAHLARCGVAAEFDLLALGGDGGEPWETPAGYCPRVVVGMAAQRPGYALVAVEANGTSAIFVRRDLLAATGFPERIAGA